MTTEQLLPKAVRDAPPTATVVYLALEHAGPMTYKDLVEELGASRRAVENAIADLQAHDLVTDRPDTSQPCRKRWGLT